MYSHLKKSINSVKISIIIFKIHFYFSTFCMYSHFINCMFYYFILPSKTTLFFQFSNYISLSNMLPSQELLNKISVELFEKILQFDYKYLNVSICVILYIL